MSVLKRSWLGCPVRSSGFSGLLKSSKKPPLIHQTEARLIRRYSGYPGRVELMLPELIEHRFVNRILYTLSFFCIS
jgi:hypothetical protein